jgi:periplasmic divalent cation tolerance protein
VKDQLVACANIIPNMIAIYRWEGNVEQAEEVTVLLKTRATLYAEVEKRIKELHSYENPAIYAIPLVNLSAEYRNWLFESTREPLNQGM